jgi:hypothetical protein
MSKIVTVSLIEANKKVGLEVNAKKTKIMLMPREQNTEQNYDTRTANRTY